MSLTVPVLEERPLDSTHRVEVSDGQPPNMY